MMIFKLFKPSLISKLQRRNVSVKFISEAFINGSWVKSKDGSIFPVFNPATGELLAEVSDLSPNDTDEAISAASKAFEPWSRTTGLERSRILRTLNEIILKNEEELSHLITLENGKCLSDSLAEIRYAASFMEWFSNDPCRIMGKIVPSAKPDRRAMLLKQPIGVVAVITPWNFPVAMVTRKLGAILAAGCTCVMKPAEDTPLSLLRLVDLIGDELPPGVVNIVTASRLNGPIIGRTFCTDTRVKAVTFTGSSEVGKILYHQSADTMKRLSLELGGNAPMLIFESADVDLAVKVCMSSKFRNSGQTCLCANRIMVHESIHDQFVKRLAQATASELKVGYGLESGVNQGPLINRDAVRKVEQLINRSVQMGAEIKLGGQRLDLDDFPHGNFFQPTIISNCSNQQPLHKNEIFGPVAAISKFSAEADAVRRANQTNTGLAAYIVSEDHRQVWRVSELLHAGIVAINEGVVSASEVPMSGWGESGLGTESGVYGVEEYLQHKSVVWGALRMQ